MRPFLLWLCRCSGALAWLLLISGSALAQTPAEPDLAAIDRFIESRMEHNRIPGLAVAITVGDEVFYLRGFGTARDEEPMTPQTQFYIASLSKSFTALAVMQLVDQGRIELDAPVQRYLPEFTTADPGAASRITVRDLLNQTSGLSDAGFPEYTLPQPSSLEERVQSLRDARLVSEPGTEYHYFNPNYAVLARIVEVTSREGFSEYLRRQIFEPLEMHDTASIITSAETPRAAPQLAQGHIQAFGVPIALPELDGYLGGAGGVISTAEDMANYLIMQGNGGRFKGMALVSPEGLALMHAPPQQIDSPYAMGWIVEDPNARPLVIEHNGVLSTFYADAVLLPNQGYGIVLLYSYNYALADYNGIKHGLIDLVIGSSPDTGGPSARTLGLLLASAVIVTVALQVRSLLRLRQWAAATLHTSAWRLAPGIVGHLVPLVLLISLQRLVLAFSGRAYTYPQLFRAMPDLMLWLVTSAVLGLAIGLGRAAFLARRMNSSHATS